MKQLALFDERFIESFAGKAIFADPIVAIIELIANSWDAGATQVKISWPVQDSDKFQIIDNGHGMNVNQFNRRYRKLAYNRVNEQGKYAEIPEEHKKLIAKRPAFGRSGKGRLAGFAFGDKYIVKSWRDGLEIRYEVFIDNKNQLAFNKREEDIKKDGHGTEVVVEKCLGIKIPIETVKNEIGMRFLTDPHFEVLVNNEAISFIDIPEENIEEIPINIDKVGEILIKVIDVQTTDKTTQQHGIAWHVKNRLVGECTWKGSGSEHLIDGRRIAAKRYIFIVKADCLEDAVVPDWTMFISSNPKYKKAFPIVQEAIKEHLLSLTKSQRESTFKEIEQLTKPMLKSISLVSREKWEQLIINIQEECPSISQFDLEKIASLLAKLEQTNSKYSLINLLASASVEELEDLNSLIKKWDIDFAKIVLDEVEYRLKLIEKLQIKVLSKKTDEVQDLQPLFHRGLWIFGPEYETIEYTSNQGMTKVIQEIFGGEDKGSRKRPDFAILPDSSVGLYSFSKYNDSGEDIGIAKLTIVELKKPGVPIGEGEISQAWNYAKELYNKGLLKSDSMVTCFVLGDELEPQEAEETTKKGGKVIILPLDYDTVMRRAKSRLLKLYDKIKNAPFLEKTRIKEYISERESELF
jgi:hypothetical protein